MKYIILANIIYLIVAWLIVGFSISFLVIIIIAATIDLGVIIFEVYRYQSNKYYEEEIKRLKR